ncbi:hypothetical protein lerEdw1_018263 [Lerista edwardsae]|nr:hypothetical protein lerEdw1_018263 [Lerista edwardsae]
MRFSTMAAFAVLSLQVFFLAQGGGGKLAGKGLVAEEHPAGSAQARKPLDPSQEANGEAERRQPSARLRKVAGEVGGGGGSHSQAGSKSPLGSSKKAGSKRQIVPSSPPKGKSQGLQDHLKGHGKFNTETVSQLAYAVVTPASSQSCGLH